jgi:hypothetical protein
MVCENAGQAKHKRSKSDEGVFASLKVFEESTAKQACLDDVLKRHPDEPEMVYHRRLLPSKKALACRKRRHRKTPTSIDT